MGQGAHGSRRPLRRGADDAGSGRVMDARRTERRVVVGLGAVDPTLVTGVLGDEVQFIPTPTHDDMAVAEGAIVRADAVVDAAFLDRAPRMRVLARTGVGPDLVDLDAATAWGWWPGQGAAPTWWTWTQRPHEASPSSSRQGAAPGP